MTMYSKEQIESLKEAVIGRKVTDFYHEDDGDYYVMVFDDGSEMSFRYMSDIVNR